jgi:hypothetical protein
MYSHPFNVIRSSQCDIDYKLFLLDSAIAYDLKNALRRTNDWDSTKSNTVESYLSHYPGLLSAYFSCRSNLANGSKTKRSVCGSLNELIGELVLSHTAIGSCGAIETFIAEFASESEYHKRASTCRRIFLSDPSNIRALYLCYFFSQVGRGYKYALDGRYRLYQSMLRLSAIYSIPSVLSPLIGVSIGHYYLLAQTACTRADTASAIKVVTSAYQIGFEIIEHLNRILDANIEVRSYSRSLSLDTLSECLSADVLSYSHSVANGKSVVKHSFETSSNIVLHLRTEGYKFQGGFWNLLRNANPSNFELLGRSLLRETENHKLVRIRCEGDMIARRSVWRSHVVNDEKSAVQQWEIMSDSSFFIGCNSGISALAPFLSKSSLIVNATSLWSVVALGLNTVFALKRITGKKTESPVVCRDDFIRLVYLDWVGNGGLASLFSIEELSPEDLLSAFLQARSNCIVSFSAICNDIGVNIAPGLPERYLTVDCASNLRSIAMSLPLNSSGLQLAKLSRVMWQ